MVFVDILFNFEEIKVSDAPPSDMMMISNEILQLLIRDAGPQGGGL